MECFGWKLATNSPGKLSVTHVRVSPFKIGFSLHKFAVAIHRAYWLKRTNRRIVQLVEFREESAGVPKTDLAQQGRRALSHLPRSGAAGLRQRVLDIPSPSACPDRRPLVDDRIHRGVGHHAWLGLGYRRSRQFPQPFA